MDVERLLPGRVTELPTAKYIFVALVALLLAIAAGQWYLLEGLTELYLGVPLWLWYQLAIIGVMLVLAWVAVTVWTSANSGNVEVSERDADTEETEW